MRRVLLALLLTLASCVAPPPPLERDRSDPGRSGPDRSEPVEAAVERRVSEVSVRLSAQERKERVRIDGTPLGTITFERDGRGVRSSQGGFATSFTVESAPRGEGLTLGGRVYPGVLVVTPHRAHGLRVENHVELETYIAGVVPAELVLWSALPAEIEAQAITARTYALRCLLSGGGSSGLWDDTRHQVYLGRFQAGDSPTARRVAARFASAMARSEGLVLRDSRGALLDVRFHASCGGHTASSEAATGGSARVAVACEPCARIGSEERARPEAHASPRVHWSWTADAADLTRLARSLDIGDRVLTLRPGRIDRFGRWRTVEVSGSRRTTEVKVVRLRTELGADRLRSGRILRTWPRAGEPIDQGVFFEGLGWGHGEGLCQVGAHEYATAGRTARELLLHYFPGSQVAALPPATPSRDRR